MFVIKIDSGSGTQKESNVWLKSEMCQGSSVVKIWLAKIQ